jgi:twinkle protein
VVPYRGHSRATLEKYGVKGKVSDATGELYEVEYPYHDGATKYRSLKDKKFSWKDFKGPSLWGKDKFASGSAQAVTITEGEEDAMAAYEMLGSKYPVVSVQSSGQAIKDCAADKEWLDGFDKIYLCFDNDDQGRRAEHAVSSLFPFNKIYIVRKNRYKDANDYLLSGNVDEYKKIWWASKRHDPENIISSFTDLREVFKKPKKHAICSFPFKGLQDATYGIRTGETYLFKALEGIGKTEVMGAIEYHAAKTCTFPIGIIHLEEDIQRSAFRLVGYEVEQPVHLEGVTDFTADQLADIYEKLAGADNRINFYQAGKNDNDVDSFLNAIRFMVASAGCKIVFFDHISRVATAFNLDVAGLDNFATRLSQLAIELDFALIAISHVNDDGLTRGSRNISKEAWTVISLYRDKINPDPLVRNTTSFVVEKNRQVSITGPAGEIYFDPLTFKLSDEPPPMMPGAE